MHNSRKKSSYFNIIRLEHENFKYLGGVNIMAARSYALQLETIFRGKYPASGFSADNFEVNPADELERGLELFHTDNLISFDTLNVEELIAQLKEFTKQKDQE